MSVVFCIACHIMLPGMFHNKAMIQTFFNNFIAGIVVGNVKWPDSFSKQQLMTTCAYIFWNFFEGSKKISSCPDSTFFHMI